MCPMNHYLIIDELNWFYFSPETCFNLNFDRMMKHWKTGVLRRKVEEKKLKNNWEGKSKKYKK